MPDRADPRFRRLVESLPVGLIYRAGERIVANPAVEELTGYTPAELATVDDWFARLYGADAARIRAYYEADRAAGFVGTRTVRVRRKDGAMRTVEFRGFRAEDVEGWVLYDVTAREEALAATEEARSRTRALLDSIPGIAWLKSADGRYLAVNAPFRTLVERAPEEIYGRTDAELFPPELAAQYAATDAEVLRTGRALTTESQQSDATGVHWFETVKVPFRDADGQVAGTVGIHREITERRALEDQLRQAQKMEAVGRLAGGIAHDFNNLLASVGLNATLLLDLGGDLDPAARRDALLEIRSATERAALLTRQLLTFGRRRPVERRPVDLSQVVLETAPLLRRLGGPGVELEIAPAADLPPVEADPMQLAQVLMNLAVNARDAMPGGGRLRIEIQAVAPGAGAVGADTLGLPSGEWVLLVVSDTGMGMDPSTQARIFEPFFTTKPVGQGTGLGLSTVFGIVSEAGGRVFVESAPGRGATFTVALPASAAAVTTGAPAPGAPAQAPADDAARVRGGRETILLVEDETGLRRTTARLLARYGYQVLQARHGADALRVLAEHPGDVDLVVTDLVMPELDGAGLIERLRTVAPRLPVLVTSGYHDTADPELFAGRALALLEKPYEVGDLLREVRLLLDAR